jgi:hypothetical protein
MVCLCNTPVPYDLTCIFHNFCEHEIWKKSLNATFIALIPKKIGQLEVEDFRPISMMGVCIKVIMKVLATRIK